MGASDFSKLPHIGESLRRKEDYRFLTGAGNYTDDIRLDNMTHAVFVRSPHAHANIKSINKAKALAAPGVVAVLDGPDVVDAKINGLPCGWLITDTSGKPMNEPPHPILANGKGGGRDFGTSQKRCRVGGSRIRRTACSGRCAPCQKGHSPSRRSAQ
jgi:carbon-monoxide dehydrogenase large subunit